MPKGAKYGGRVKGTPNKATQHIREILDKNVDFNVVTQKLYELVKGVSVRGEYGVYKEKPDAYAAKILLEYRYGKPKESVDITSAGIPVCDLSHLSYEQLLDLAKKFKEDDSD